MDDPTQKLNPGAQKLHCISTDQQKDFVNDFFVAIKHARAMPSWFVVRLYGSYKVSQGEDTCPQTSAQ